MSEAQTFWQYIREQYGVDASYSDTGWRVKLRAETFSDGEVNTGLLKYKMGLKQDVKRLNEQKLGALRTIRNLLSEQFKRDRLLQEKYGAIVVVARRRTYG